MAEQDVLGLLTTPEAPPAAGASIESRRPGSVHVPAREPSGPQADTTALESGWIQRTHTPEGRARALSALASLSAGDPDEQRETLEYLERVIDEDRLSYRKRFR
ncbi:MAG TPA: hypothetical protein VFJ58_29325 [Armatimonadota bacterium]|nr:hypothetical protein [Armatimonadota bacterium]